MSEVTPEMIEAGWQALLDEPDGPLTPDAALRVYESMRALEPEFRTMRELLEKAAPFVGWAAARNMTLAGSNADELCDEIDAALGYPPQPRISLPVSRPLRVVGHNTAGAVYELPKDGEGVFVGPNGELRVTVASIPEEQGKQPPPEFPPGFDRPSPTPPKKVA